MFLIFFKPMNQNRVIQDQFRFNLEPANYRVERFDSDSIYSWILTEGMPFKLIVVRPLNGRLCFHVTACTDVDR